MLIDRNNLFPIVTKRPDNIGLGTYLLCSDGTYFIKPLSGGGNLSIKVDGIPGLSKGSEEINFLKRKIPISAFWTIVKFLRYVSTYFNQSLEAYAIIGYSNKEDKYCIWIPEHTVTGGSVKYDISKFSKEYPGYYIVLDLHSHGTMGSFFSSTDNADDVRGRFSGVIGYVSNLIPEYKFRFSANRKYWDYELDQLFEENYELFELDFEKEIKKISILKEEAGFVTSNGMSRTVDRIPLSNNWVEKYMINKWKNREFTLEELFPEHYNEQ